VIELKEKRTTHGAVFDPEEPVVEGKKKYKYKAKKNYHYNNVLELGDGKSSYPRKVDKTPLVIDGGWQVLYGDDITTIPEYFGRDSDWLTWSYIYDSGHPVKFRPDCDAVQGVLVLGGIGGWGQIEYIGAFGPGVDLVIVPLRTKMQKLVRFTDLSKGNTQLRFEIESTTQEAFDQYVQGYAIWDDSLRAQDIQAEVIQDAGKTYLVKTIPDISGMEGIVYTDATFGPEAISATDAWLQCAATTIGAGATAVNANWLAAWNYNGALTTLQNHASRDRAEAGFRGGAFGYEISRTHMYFDITVGFDSVTSGTITVYMATVYEWNGSQDNATIVAGMPANPDNIATTDYGRPQFGTVALVSTEIDSTLGSQVLPLNAAGLAAIPENDKFNVGYILERDRANNDPLSTWPRMDISNGEVANAPVLDFTYVVTAAGGDTGVSTGGHQNLGEFGRQSGGMMVSNGQKIGHNRRRRNM